MLAPSALLVSPPPPPSPQSSSTSQRRARAAAAAGRGGVLRVLLVTAHPDDECMFFAPLLLGLDAQQQRANGAAKVLVSVLCLSSGNADGLGSVRKTELTKSCAELGIAPDRVTVIDHPQLQDSMNVWWKEDVVAEMVRAQLAMSPADVIVTFDKTGVSGHMNHRAVYHGVRWYIHTRKDAPPAYCLTSVTLLRKFSGILDLVPTLGQHASFGLQGARRRASGGASAAAAAGAVLERGVFVASPTQVVAAVKAMFCHKSQLVWFRYLYLLFSRYLIMNELERIR
ncbi:putative deacetylase LmbE-like domain-containing protein [Zopfochytrium polystomum]|nr:putative deacetylase LmbE-like domain-containing protein [Zopfochytrium polystomum]